MQIIIKYIMRSMLEKKFRTFLIILAITLSGSLFFASTSLADNLTRIYIKQLRQVVGESDIQVIPNKDSPSDYINMRIAYKIKERTEYIIPILTVHSKYKTGVRKYDGMMLRGIELNHYRMLSELAVIEQGDLTTFEGAKAIISKNTADKYNLKLEEEIELYINGVKKKFTIAAIALSKGLFAEESKNPYVIIPFETLSRLTGSNGGADTLYIKGISEESLDDLKEALKKIYPKYTIENAVNPKLFTASVERITQPLMLMTVIVILMSIFIIYSSFRVIMLEKLPVVGTFRSLGAAKKTMNKVLFLESLFYGVMGGLLSLLFGAVILYILMFTSTPASIKAVQKVTVSFSAIRFITTFITANVICLVSTLMPIINVSRIPLKEIVLNNISSKKSNRLHGAVLGIACIIAAFVIPLFKIRSLAMLSSMVSIVLVVIGVIKTVPLFVFTLGHMLEGPFGLIFGNVGILAVKNVKKNKSILNSTALITIGISTLLLINTVKGSMEIEILNFFRTNFIYDLTVMTSQIDKQTVRSLRRMEHITGAYPVYGAYAIKVKEKGTSIAIIEGIGGKDYTEYNAVKFQGDKEELIHKLHEGRSIIISQTLKDWDEYQIGDKVTLELQGGEKVYIVIGFVDTFLGEGSFGLVSETYLKRDMQSPYYTHIYAKTDDVPEEMKEQVKELFKDRFVQVTTVENMLRQEDESNAQLMGMLTGFAFLSLVIGVIGVVNNLIISFIERRKGIAVLKSIGMSKKQVIGMIFIEALCAGGIGGIMGIVGGVLLIKIVPPVLDSLKVPLVMHILPHLFIPFFIAGIVITIIASIAPAYKTSKLNIIEAIKYE